jgi:tellurite resistance protein
MGVDSVVRRFGDFVAAQAPDAAQSAGPEQLFPHGLAEIRDAFGHHIVPLLLLARADGEVADVEREAILDYCIARARAAGIAVSLADRAALTDYLRDFKPSRMQLDRSLKRLEREPPESMRALIAAAQAVVDADGVRRAGEMRFLTELQHDLTGS